MLWCVVYVCGIVFDIYFCFVGEVGVELVVVYMFIVLVWVR